MDFMAAVRKNLAIAHDPNSVVAPPSDIYVPDGAVAVPERQARVRTPELEAELAANQARYRAEAELVARANAARQAQPIPIYGGWQPPAGFKKPIASPTRWGLLMANAMAGAVRPVGAGPRKIKKPGIVTARPEQQKIATNHMWYDRGDGGSATLVAEARQKLQAARLDAFKRRHGQAAVQRTIKDYDAEF